MSNSYCKLQADSTLDMPQLLARAGAIQRNINLQQQPWHGPGATAPATIWMNVATRFVAAVAATVGNTKRGNAQFEPLWQLLRELRRLA